MGITMFQVIGLVTGFLELVWLIILMKYLLPVFEKRLFFILE